MKKFAVVLVWFGLLGLSVFAQTRKNTRPRVVTNPSPAKTQKNTQNTKTTSNRSSDEDWTDIPPPPPPPREIIPEVVEEDEIIKVETNLVTMPVSVFDRNGKFVANLRQNDFRIFENGRQQEIEYFANIETPFTVVLMIDTSPSTKYRINEMQDLALNFLDQLRRDDKVIIVTFDQRVRVWNQATNNRSILRDVIRQTDFGNGTSLYDAVNKVTSEVLPEIEGRKAVVLFTDGVDTTSKRANYQSTLSEVQRSEALFYPIRYDTYDPNADATAGTSSRRRGGGNNSGVGGILGGILGAIITGNVNIGGGGLGTSRAEHETGRRYLEDIGNNGGGRLFQGEDKYKLETSFVKIAEELRQQYSIGYYPAVIGREGERKEIDVRVMRGGLTVRARESYIVGDTLNNFAGK